MDSHMLAFVAGVVVGAVGVFAAVWFDIGMDKAGDVFKRIFEHKKRN